MIPSAIVSLHDVMPETMAQVEAILTDPAVRSIPPISLLVVPGKAWTPQQIQRLQQLASAGHELVAHGWHHHVAGPRGIYHRVHAALLSRDVAEHLALDPAAIHDLMQRSHQWFLNHDLPAPNLYVPPAWALGPISTRLLRQLPFEQIEILRGFLHPASGRLLSLPLVGFEADSALRANCLSLWNRSQIGLSRLSGRPLRIGLHPNDFQLRLEDQLHRILSLIKA